KYKRALLHPTCIAEDSVKACNLECTEESNTCQEGQIMDEEDVPLQQQADHASEAACFDDENKEFTSGSLAQHQRQEKIKPEDRQISH
ncbi:hypothetical protein PV325_011639, partial [Microctonus aethiopoides]